MRPVVFSASSVNAYLSCHLQWYFGYVLNEQGEQSEAQAVGIAVHDYAEGRLRERNDTPMTPPARGEFTLVIEGKPEGESQPWTEDELLKTIR